MSTDVNAISRRGIVTFDHFMQPGNEIQQDLKRWLLLYDEFLVPNLSQRMEAWRNLLQEQPDEEYERAFVDLEWLVSKKQLIESPVNFETVTSHEDELISELREFYTQSWADTEKTYDTPEEAATGTVAAQFNVEIAISRLIAYVLWKEKEELVYPVVFPFENEISGFETLSKRQNVLSIVLDQLPEPDDNLPLQDIVDFKSDNQTKEKYYNLWKWISKTSKGNSERAELREEIQYLLHDYSANLRRLTKQTSLTRIKTIVSASGDLVKNLVSFQWGKVLGVGIEMKEISMKASDDELKLPGSELAYIKEAAGVLAKGK